MTIWPRSLFGRLLGIAALSTIGALVFAGLTIGHVLEHFVVEGLDDRLDAQVMVLARAIRRDGTIDPDRVIALPGFDDAGSGWAWRIDGPGRLLVTSGTDADMVVPRHRHDDGDDAADLVPQPPPQPRAAPGGPSLLASLRPDKPRAIDAWTRRGRVHARTLSIATGAGMVTLTAIAPRHMIEAPLREALVPLLLSLAVLGAGLALATLVQLRVGLQPIRGLRVALADIRAGRRRHVPAGQPAELAPLVDELNALIVQNEAGLAHARRHVANLAHGLKTPLAALALQLAQDGRDPDGSLTDTVGQIDRRIRHHLRRARAAAPGGTRARTALAPAIADLADVLARVHADRTIGVRSDVPELVVGVDAQDLDEMVGNLLDNAWRHARATILIEAAPRGAMIAVSIADDGPGISDTMIAEALLPGRRLDEQGDGHGFGLSITRELAELNGGALEIGRSRAGGLAVCLILPAAAD